MNKKIEDVCQCALRIASVLDTHPLNTITNVPQFFIGDEDDLDLFRLNCHKWLYEHRSEFKWIIRNPN